MLEKRAVVLLGMHLMAWNSCQAQSCVQIEPVERAGGFGASIAEPGKFCLPHSLKQTAVFDLHAGRYKVPQGPMLRIRCRQKKTCPSAQGEINYEIDLQGNSLSGEASSMIGIDNMSGGTGVHIRNGSIAVRGDRSIGVLLFGERTPTGFVTTDYLLEKLTIRAGGQGVNVSGAGNVLRNSVIEVDGHTAAYLFGPGSVVENNTFIVHASGAQKAQQAALQLRAADGAVVRNNRFVFKGGWARRGGVAISLVDSAGVTVKDNTVDGFERQLLLDGSTTAAQP